MSTHQPATCSCIFFKRDTNLAIKIYGYTGLETENSGVILGGEELCSHPTKAQAAEPTPHNLPCKLPNFTTS